MWRVQQLEDRLIARTNSIFGQAVGYRKEEAGVTLAQESMSIASNSECERKLGDASSECERLFFRGREALIQSCFRVYLVCGRADDCQTVLRREVRVLFSLSLL